MTGIWSTVHNPSGVSLDKSLSLSVPEFLHLQQDTDAFLSFSWVEMLK